MTHTQESQPQSLFDSVKTFTVRVPVNEPVNLFTLAGLGVAKIEAACIDYLHIAGRNVPMFNTPSCLGYPDTENEDNILFSLGDATGFIKVNGDCHVTANASITGCMITFNYRLES